MALMSAKSLVWRVALVIACGEALVMALMMALGWLPATARGLAIAAVDALLLSLLCTPPLYYWVVRPFVRARDQALAHANELAHTDALTGLANRRMVERYLATLIAGNVRHGTVGAVLVLDLDGFKAINDQHGHAAGDATLVEVARRLRAVVRSEDVVGRIGGDEFVVLVHRFDGVPALADQRALRVAEKLVRTLEDPVEFRGQSLAIGTSVGIRMLPPRPISPDEALLQADQAMYQAKARGRGQAVIHPG